MDAKINMPEYISKAISMLNENGFEAYAVGGCIRDTLMGKIPYDWDVTTSALPEETLNVFKNCKTLDIGIKHGTVTVIIDRNNVEITTFRVDGLYSDNRHPDKVSFSRSIENDLSRRDFTVNALAYSPSSGIIDKFNGIDDLHNKIIRCVGEPDKRFNEDALRIMRGIRFASVLCFDIEENTSKSILENAVLLKNIAVERISAEFNKLLSGKNAGIILKKYKEVISVFIPEIKNVSDKLWNKSVTSLSLSKDDTALRLSLILKDIENSEIKSKEVLSSLHYDNNTINTVCKILSFKDDKLFLCPKKIKHHIFKHGVDNIKSFTEFWKCTASDEEKNHLKKYMEILNETEKSGYISSLSDLAVDGNDISALGFSGKKIREILNCIAENIIDDNLKNDKNEIIQFVRNNFNLEK